MSDAIPATTVGDVDELATRCCSTSASTTSSAAGHAPDVRHHPLGSIPTVWDSLPTGRTILCICRSGARSAQATAFLCEQGLDAVNLEGGMQAWMAFGLEVVRDDGDRRLGDLSGGPLGDHRRGLTVCRPASPIRGNSPDARGHPRAVSVSCAPGPGAGREARGRTPGRTAAQGRANG